MARQPAARADAIDRRERPPRAARAVPAAGPGEDEGGAPGAGATQAVAAASIATGRDDAGAPLHRGWSPVASHHRWLEPFVLMALASGSTHGYAIVGLLTEIGMSDDALDVGQVYRTLRDLEQNGQITSTWTTGSGPARRDYTITEQGSRALDEWAAVMKERHRLIGEFDAAYLAWVSQHPGPSRLP